eukprot:5382967-Prymnesium_polylepis.1
MRPPDTRLTPGALRNSGSSSSTAWRAAPASASSMACSASALAWAASATCASASTFMGTSTSADMQQSLRRSRSRNEGRLLPSHEHKAGGVHELLVQLIAAPPLHVHVEGAPLFEREADESATVPMHQAPTMYSPAPELPPGPNFPRRRPQRELGSSALRLE